ncbi:MAG: hypothetical protein P4L87_24230 [Formivibrio sp.]|nr:hypothetical protein [Formivibrio sp.]
MATHSDNVHTLESKWGDESKSDVDVRDKVIEHLIDEGNRDSSYDIMRRLSGKLVAYLMEQKIPSPPGAMDALRNANPGVIILFVRQHIIPRKDSLIDGIKAEAAKIGATISSDQIAKIQRFGEAMCEVASA